MTKCFKKSYALIAALFLSAALLAPMTPAKAQFAPSAAGFQFRNTYRAAITGLVTAASATDFFTISGSASKVVAITQFDCSGIGSTAGTADLQVIKRSTLDLTGTSTTPTAVALTRLLGGAGTVITPVATAIVRAYTVNPGTLGTLIGLVDSNKLNLPLAATGAAIVPLRFVFSDARNTQPILLVGVNDLVALNGNGATLAAGANLDCSVEWYEY